MKIATLERRSRNREEGGKGGRGRKEKKRKGKERKGKKRRSKGYTLASRAGILERDWTRDTHALPKS